MFIHHTRNIVNCEDITVTNHFCPSLEFETNLCEDFTISKKAPTAGKSSHEIWYVDVKILTNTGLKESMLHNKPP